MLARGVRRFLVLTACSSAPYLYASAQTTPAATHGFVGVITDSAGAPIGAVEILILTNGAPPTLIATSRSLADGTFSIAHTSSGRLLLRARRLGYRAVEYQLAADSIARFRRLNITMESAPVELAAVHVEADRTAAMREFYDRRSQGGTGRFIDRAEIVKKGPMFASDLLRSYPGMHVRPSTKFGNTIRLRGCKPAVYLDGVEAMGAELDDVTLPSEIEGIEIYSAISGVPPQYSARQARTCGAILVWTRIR